MLIYPILKMETTHQMPNRTSPLFRLRDEVWCLMTKTSHRINEWLPKQDSKAYEAR